MHPFSLVRTVLILWLCGGALVSAGKNKQVVIRIQPFLFGNELSIGDTLIGKDDTVSIESLRFYLSEISFFHLGKRVYSDQQKAHLVDCSIASKRNIELTLPPRIEFDQIRMKLGIDSITNVSGALGGDLDPSLGMYWAWQSGYINFKLEGYHSRSKARDKSFHFHLGGYLPPFASVQDLVFSTGTKKDTINIGIDLGQFFESVDLAQSNSVMSPGKTAMEYSIRIATLFRPYESE